MYAAFDRGDVPAILEHIADDVEWEAWPGDWSPYAAGAPWLQRQQGRDGVLTFFAQVSGWEIRDFQVREIVGDGRTVIADCAMDATPTGGSPFRDEELHVWTFGDAGRVVRFRHYVDTAKHIRAARPA